MKGPKRKRGVWSLLIIAVVLICIKLGYNFITSIDTSAIVNNNEGKVQCIGHGGNGVQSIFPFQTLPCNTERSIQKSLEAGIDGIELDVQITADSVLVLYHDQRLEDATPLTGCIGNSNWDDIKGAEYTIGAPYDWFQNEVLISFEKGLDMLLEQEEFPILHIDFHGLNYCDDNLIIQLDQFCRALDRMLLGKNIPMDKVFLIGTHENILREFVKMESKPNLIFEITREWDKSMEAIERLGIEHILARLEMLSVERVEYAHNNRISVTTFRGKTRWGIAKRIDLNVDAIQTDGVQTMLDMLDDE